MRLRVFTYAVLVLLAGVALSCDKSDKSLDATGTYSGKTEVKLMASENVLIDELKRYEKVYESSKAAVVKSLTESKAVVVTFTMGFLPTPILLDFVQSDSDDTGARYTVKEKVVIDSQTGLIRRLVVKDAARAAYKKSGEKSTFDFVLNVEATLQIRDFDPVKYEGTISFTTK